MGASMTLLKPVTAVAVLLSALAVAVGPAGAGPAVDSPKLAEAIVIRHVVPRYRALVEATTGFGQVAETACPKGDMAAMRTAFSDTMDAWMAVQHIRFGPAVRADRHVRIQYWPDKHNQISRQLGRLLAAADEAALSPDRFAAATVALQGLPAVERLIFSADASSGAQGGDYGCRLIDAIAVNLHAIAGDALAGWQALPVGETVAEGIVDSVLTQFQVIGELKLLRPLGKDAVSARPRLAESWRSARSGRNVRINIEALADLWNGGQGADLRTAAVAADDGTGQVAALDDGFAVALRTAARLDDSLAPDLIDERLRKSVNFLGVHLSGLRELIARNVAPPMGVTLGFNALDGD